MILKSNIQRTTQILESSHYIRKKVFLRNFFVYWETSHFFHISGQNSEHVVTVLKL